MSKQERRARKSKKADEQAATIISAAVATATMNTARPEGISDEDWSVAQQVKGLRDEGMAWWQIAQTLSLPGAGNSASTGKKGAAQARKAYAKGYGAHPRSFTRGQGRSRREKNEQVRAMQQTTKRDRVAKVRTGKHVIDVTLNNEDLAAMLKGRKIQWMIMGDICPEGLEMEAWIHPRAPLYIEGEGAERIIEFREMDKRAPMGYRDFPGPIRTVRIANIFSVRGER